VERLRYISILLACLLFTSFWSCNQAGFRNNISEGIIEYQIEYPDIDSNNIMRELMPDKMVLKFKGDRFKTELKAAAGIVETNFISNASEQTLTSMVKLFSERYAIVMDQQQTKKFNSAYPSHTLTPVEETAEIAGVTCKKILVDFGTSRGEDTYFYYTDEIALTQPNWGTPFPDIQGVLLDYEMENYDVRMHLTATNIWAQKIDESEFDLPESYRLMSYDEFQQKVTKDLGSFSE